MALLLLIDDDPFYRRVIEQALREEGHDVVVAEDGAEGIAAYRQRRPDLVITDMRLPGMEGSEVIRALRKFDESAKIIAVSGAATFYDIDLFKLAREAGADAIVRKLPWSAWRSKSIPCSATALNNRCRRARDRRTNRPCSRGVDCARP